MAYSRAVLKISGEMFCGVGQAGIAAEEIISLVEQIGEAQKFGCKLGGVVGGGNLVRGEVLAKLGFDRVSADQMGMVSTVVNMLALKAALKGASVAARFFSAVEVERFVDPYSPHAARQALDSGEVVILAGGTGNPYVTTDTAAALRSAELGAEILLKGTKVDAVYSADPNACEDAERYDRISYEEVLDKQLAFMDSTAVALCRENDIPILVFCLRPFSNLLRAIRGEKIGTLVGKGE